MKNYLLTIFIAIFFSLFQMSCSKKKYSCEPTQSSYPGGITAPNVKTPEGVISPYFAIQIIAQDIFSSGLYKLKDLDKLKTLKLSHYLVVENYHPSEEFRRLEPYFIIVIGEYPDNSNPFIARVYAMKNHKKPGKIAEATENTKRYRYITQEEAEYEVSRQFGINKSLVQSKAVFIYDGQKNMWNLLLSWGWAVGIQNSAKGINECYYVFPKTSNLNKGDSKRGFNSSNNVKILKINQDIFNEKTSKSINGSSIKLLPL